MRILAFLCAMMVATASVAADLTVVVRTGAGRPVTDAVVSLYPAAGTPPASQAHFDWPMRMVQQHLQFSPFVLIAPAGASVAFPNLDPVRHHVYSFSESHPFELKLYGRDETRTVHFDHLGVIALGCNIHDQMIAFIKVVDTPYAAKTGANGEAVLRDVPTGAATMRVWHPYMKSPANEVTRTVTVAHGGARVSVSVEVRNPPERTGGY
jgi:plastocyanin